MRAYRVEGGPAQIGSSEVVGLTPAQFGTRAHRVTKDPKRSSRELVVVTVVEPIEFKAGEVIWLPVPPAKGMADRLVPVDGEPDGRPRPAVEGAKGTEKGARAKKVAKPPAADPAAAAAEEARKAAEVAAAAGGGQQPQA